MANNEQPMQEDAELGTCRCGHSASFHRHNDDLLEIECGSYCAHFRCIYPNTLTDFSPRATCECLNYVAAAQPEPAREDAEPWDDWNDLNDGFGPMGIRTWHDAGPYTIETGQRDGETGLSFHFIYNETFTDIEELWSFAQSESRKLNGPLAPQPDFKDLARRLMAELRDCRCFVVDGHRPDCPVLEAQRLFAKPTEGET